MITGELSSHVLWADLLTERRSLGNRIQQQPNDHKVHNECRWTHVKASIYKSRLEFVTTNLLMCGPMINQNNRIMCLMHGHLPHLQVFR
ncbi:hypothetical protein YC2023_020999 [Brassica napus]